MWLNSWLLALTFGYGCWAQTLIQPQASITKSIGKTGRIRCDVKGATISSTNPIHWYQQKPGQPITRILYFGDSVNRDSGFGSSYNAGKNERSEFYLSIEKLTAKQSATYYCGFWVYISVTSGSWKKIFGQGTQLIVTNKKPSAPTVRLFPPKLQNDKGFVACLVTDFFPNVINVKWKIDDKTLSSNLLEISVNQMEGGTYSTIDHLEVTKVEWEEKTIVCYVEHEAGNEKASTSRKKREEAHTSEVPENPKCPPKDKDLPEIMVEGTSSSSLRVAIFTYTLLLMKSVLYCGIISFIVYKVEYRDTKKPL